MVNYPNNPTVGQRFTLPSGVIMECVEAGATPIWDAYDPRLDAEVVKQVGSIEELRTKAGAFNGQQISLTSYHAGDNKGGGIFVWDADSTNPDDDKTTYAVTGVAMGRWVRKSTQFIQFNTITELKAAESLFLGQLVVTTGYLSATDGRGAMYEIVAGGTGATTDGKYEALTASGYQAKKLDGVRNYLNNRYDLSTDSMIDWANFPEAVRRLSVLHHYNDAEVSVIDNVGENNVFLLLRNASNPVRRFDKDEFFVGTADFLRLQNRLWDAGALKVASVFDLKYDGRFVWGNQAVTPRNNGVILENAQVTSNGTYSFTLKTNITTNPRLLDIKASAAKSAYHFDCIGGILARLDIPAEMTSGLHVTVKAGNLDLYAENGLLRLYAKNAKSYFVKSDTGFAFLGKHMDAASSPTNFTANPSGWQTAKGERGDFFTAGDGSYVYFCYAPNLWCRMPAFTS